MRDMEYLCGPIPITLREVDQINQVRQHVPAIHVEATVYVNPDGTFTLIIPTALPEDRDTLTCVFNLYFPQNSVSLWDGIEAVQHTPPERGEMHYSKYLISERSESNCYLFRGEGGWMNYFPDFPEYTAQYYPRAWVPPEGTPLDQLYIPDAATTIGTLVLKPYWTLRGAGPAPTYSIRLAGPVPITLTPVNQTMPRTYFTIEAFLFVDPEEKTFSVSFLNYDDEVLRRTGQENFLISYQELDERGHVVPGSPSLWDGIYGFQHHEGTLLKGRTNQYGCYTYQRTVGGNDYIHIPLQNGCIGTVWLTGDRVYDGELPPDEPDEPRFNVEAGHEGEAAEAAEPAEPDEPEFHITYSLRREPDDRL